MRLTAQPDGTDFLRSRAGRLAEYLRTCISLGKLADPLPCTRIWSKQLGVSRVTLIAAIKELRREGLVTVHHEGVRLNQKLAASRSRKAGAVRRVRLLLYGGWRAAIHQYLELFYALSDQLHRQGMELRWENADPARLFEIARPHPGARELLLLMSAPPPYQRLLDRSGRPVLHLGEVVPGLSLPSIKLDVAGTVRHATFKLLRLGFRHIDFVYANIPTLGLKHAAASFVAACAEWPKQPIVARNVPTGIDPQALTATIEQLARGVRDRHGIIVSAPVPVGMVVTALLRHRIAIPEQVEVAALFHTTEAIKLCPPPIHYPTPIVPYVRCIVGAAKHYFETGTLPPIKTTLAAEIAKDPLLQKSAFS